MAPLFSSVVSGHRAPTGPAFDVVLLCHVASALIGLGAVAVSGVQAHRLATSGPDGVAPSVRSYFAPGVNWAGRALVGVPVFGFALLALSGGAFSLRQTWVLVGLVLWVAATVWAEGALWPAERRIQALLEVADTAQGGTDAPGATDGLGSLRQHAVALRLQSVGVVLVLVVGFVVMFVQP